jgi:hypothetical protein
MKPAPPAASTVPRSLGTMASASVLQGLRSAGRNLNLWRTENRLRLGILGSAPFVHSLLFRPKVIAVGPGKLCVVAGIPISPY